MTSIINNLLARRGRRNTYESQLDSTFGDMRITSPTDTAQVWHPQKPRVAPPATKLPTPELYDGATPTEVSEPTPTDISIPAFSKFDFEMVTSDSASAFSFLPTPNYTPLHTPSHASYQSQQGLAIFDGKTNMATQLQRGPSTGLLRRRGNNNALAIYGINSTISAATSPSYSTHQTPNHSQLSSPVSPIQPGDHVVCIPSRRPLSPAEISALARRPSTSGQTSPEQVCSPTYQYYSSLNGAAIESLQSPVVTILSPVSETFSINGELRNEDGIIVLDVAADNYDHQLFQHGRSRSHSQSDHLEDPDLTPINPASLLRLLCAPPSDHYDDQDCLDELASQISSRPQSRADSIIMDDDTISVFMSPYTQSNEFVPGVGGAHNLNTNTSSTSLHSPTETSYLQTQVQTLENIVSEFRSAKSPALGDRGATRLMSPPLSTTARMRVQSPPVNSDTWGTLNRDNNESTLERHTPASYAAHPVSRAQRQRSASLEPPRSPSLFDRDPLFVQSMTKSNEVNHRRQQSNDSAHIYIPIREYGNYVQNAPHGCQRQSTSNSIAYSHHTGSQSTFTTPNLRGRPAWSKSPLPHVDSRSQFASESSYYDSIREDCRVVSRQSRATKNGALMAQFKASAEPARSDQQKTQTRARSTSRLRDRFVKEQPRIEIKQVGPQTQLVPSYKEMWE